MAVKFFSLCLLSVALLGSLGLAQQYFIPGKPQKPQSPQHTQNVKPPQYQRPGQTSQQTKTPQKPQKPDNPNLSTCAVEPHYRIQCGLPGITKTDCKIINCCYDDDTQMCYYGRAVTLQCGKDGQFIVVIAKHATLPSIDLNSVQFLGTDENCQPVATTPAFLIYHFPVTSCGTTMSEAEAGVIIYENRISTSYEVAVGPDGAITRDSQFDLMIQCRYTGTSVHALVVEALPLTHWTPEPGVGPLRVELRLGNGHCTAKGCVEADVAYSSYYLDSDYPVTKVLRDPVYVEVRILGRSDPNLVLTLGRCWATAGPYPLSLPQWDLLVDGCPYPDDRYLTTLVPVVDPSGLEFPPSHHRRFIFKMFTFVGTSSGDPANINSQDAILTPLQEMVYIHCTTAVCHGNCEPQCFRSRRDVSAVEKTGSGEDSVTVSSSPIIFVSPSTKAQ